jgi:ABC-type glycerol-3-phosphate transport system permease component
VADHVHARQLHQDLHRPDLVLGYFNSLKYVIINTVLSVVAALPAAYAFSRYRFLGDKHLFFWLLTNRMAPPAVFALPFLQLYSAVGLFDTPWAVALAHTLFNIPLAVWILEGFMSGVPKELDETAYIDGYSFPRFFIKIFIPTIAAGIGVACFFCFMFSWVELLLAKTLTSVAAKPIAATMTRTASIVRLRARPARGGRFADAHPRRGRHLLRAQLHRQGLRPRAGLRRRSGAWTSTGWHGRGRRRRSSSSSSCAW